MKNIVAFKAIKNIVCCIVVLFPLHIGLNGNVTTINQNIATDSVLNESADEVPASKKTRVVLLDLKGEYCDTRCFLVQNSETIEFLSNTFGVDSEKIIEDLVKINADKLYNEFNIGALKNNNGTYKSFDSFEKGLIEYLYVYCRENPNLVNSTRKPYTGDANYVIDLIKYFTTIYDNVDYLTAVSIGAAESGYYKVTYMLKANNVFGGMSSNGLIKYKNIEYGILSYIRLLSLNYYGKGLTTLESIGRVYCPTYNESGQKVASSHWINLVTKAKEYYKDSNNEITVDMLVND